MTWPNQSPEPTPIDVVSPHSRLTDSTAVAQLWSLGGLLNHMATRNKNWKLASICGWIGCAVGGLSIFCNIISVYVLITVGAHPATVPNVLHILQTGFLALIVGIPLGGCSWFWDAKDLEQRLLF